MMRATIAGRKMRFMRPVATAGSSKSPLRRWQSALMGEALDVSLVLEEHQEFLADKVARAIERLHLRLAVKEHAPKRGRALPEGGRQSARFAWDTLQVLASRIQSLDDAALAAHEDAD